MLGCLILQMISQVTNEDCMALMARYPDKHFNLAVVDPPYGIGISSNPFRQKHEKCGWDNAIPNKQYFDELMRVSKNQIIWGGNYFDLPPSQGFIIWDKKQPQDFSSAMCEMAWMSFQKPAKLFRKHVVTTEPNKIHPTQKPVALYDWIFNNYAKPGDLIFDSHLGSGSSRIAAYKNKLNFIGCELDKDYFEAQEKRFQTFKSQLTIF
jgi:site-specific DNA-methyltransferase (adenine-specific)